MIFILIAVIIFISILVAVMVVYNRAEEAERLRQESFNVQITPQRRRRTPPPPVRRDFIAEQLSIYSSEEEDTEEEEEEEEVKPAGPVVRFPQLEKIVQQTEAQIAAEAEKKRQAELDAANGTVEGKEKEKETDNDSRLPQREPYHEVRSPWGQPRYRQYDGLHRSYQNHGYIDESQRTYFYDRSRVNGARTYNGYKYPLSRSSPDYRRIWD